MSLSETRFGANATGLPGPTPLPPLTSALSRRAALSGAVTVAGCTAAAVVPASVQAAPLSANDRRLVDLADAMSSEEPGYDDLICRYTTWRWKRRRPPPTASSAPWPRYVCASRRRRGAAPTSRIS